MRKIAITVLALGILFFSNINAQAKKEKTKAVTSKVTFSVKGMTCSGCVEKVTKTFKNTDGIVSSKVSLDDETAVVEFDKAKVSVKEIEKSFEDSPYKVKEKVEKKSKDKENGTEKSIKE